MYKIFNVVARMDIPILSSAINAPIPNKIPDRKNMGDINNIKPGKNRIKRLKMKQASDILYKGNKLKTSNI